MIVYSQDSDMKTQLKAFKDFIGINKYLTRYMDEYILLKYPTDVLYGNDKCLMAFGNNLDYGERLVVVYPSQFNEALYMESSVEFNTKVKDFKITKALLYEGQNLISVIMQNNGMDVDLPINNITQKKVDALVTPNKHFNDINDPLKDVVSLEFVELTEPMIQTLRANKTLTISIDGRSIIFSKKILGSLQTVKDSSLIYLAKMPCEYPGKDCWCFKEVIYDSKEKKGIGVPEMVSYLIVYTIAIN